MNKRGDAARTQHDAEARDCLVMLREACAIIIEGYWALPENRRMAAHLAAVLRQRGEQGGARWA